MAYGQERVHSTATVVADGLHYGYASVARPARVVETNSVITILTYMTLTMQRCIMLHAHDMNMNMNMNMTHERDPTKTETQHEPAVRRLTGNRRSD